MSGTKTLHDVKLLIDNRETIQSLLSSIPNQEITTLELGDYVYKLDNEDFLIVERKTVSDLAASIKDGRHHEQKERLFANYPREKLMFIIEGSLLSGNHNEKYNKVSHETIVSSMMNTMYRDGVHVFHTANPPETVFLLESVFKKIQKQGNTWLKPKEISYTETVVEGLTPKKKENMTTERVFISQLACISGISLGIAKEIAGVFKNWGELKEQCPVDIVEAEKWITSIPISTSTGKRRKLGIAGKNILHLLIADYGKETEISLSLESPDISLPHPLP
jgi:ERCC4-type nuclease